MISILGLAMPSPAEWVILGALLAVPTVVYGSWGPKKTVVPRGKGRAIALLGGILGGMLGFLAARRDPPRGGDEVVIMVTVTLSILAGGVLGTLVAAKLLARPKGE